MRDDRLALEDPRAACCVGAMREERPAASTMAAIFTSACPGLAALHGGDLGDDRDGDLGGALRADIEADRRMNALDGRRQPRPPSAVARRAWRGSSCCPSAPT